MVARLRTPFLIQTLSHSPRTLQITWKDGVQSTFPNAWLRSNVRDDRFFDKSNTYSYGHISFVKQNVPISSARQQDDETIKVIWKDHISDFNASWLRAQDVASAPMSIDKMEWERWDSSFVIPEYSYHTRENELTSWTKDLKKYGLITVNDVPRNKKGFLDTVHMIGNLRRGNRPTDILRLEAWNPKYKETDPTAFGPDHFNAHTDHSYLESPAKILGFICVDYNAPLKDTMSYFTNSIRVAEDLQKIDPEAFQILSMTPFRRARRRLKLEEDCDPKDERIYDWDTYCDSPVIEMSNGEIKIVRSSPVQSSGHVLGSYDDDYNYKKSSIQHMTSLLRCWKIQNIMQKSY